MKTGITALLASQRGGMFETTTVRAARPDHREVMRSSLPNPSRDVASNEGECGNGCKPKANNRVK